MKAILVIYMTQYLFISHGETNISEENAKGYFHLFSSAVYFLPIFGALISDYLLGKFKTIIFLSIIYCLGHFVLAFDASKLGLTCGLSLIAIGSGGIKPCVSAHVGDQFSKINSTLDNEHSDIFKAIDHLYSVCDKHWKTEDKMYNEGKLKMPPNHINVSKDWETHRQEHIKLLDGIKQMKQGIITHIKEQDLQHFHWAK